MASLNGVVEFRNSEYRPCMIGNTKAIFHRWSIISEIISPSIMRGGHGGGVVSGTYGIVEFEDGTIRNVEPHTILFLDSGNLFHENEIFFRETNKGEK